MNLKPKYIEKLLNHPIKIRFKNDSITIFLCDLNNCTKYFEDKQPIKLGHLKSKYINIFFDSVYIKFGHLYWYEEIYIKGSFIQMKDVLKDDFSRKAKQS